MSNYYNKDAVNNTFVSNTGLSSTLGGYVPTSQLGNYYTKSETYSKTESNNTFATKTDLGGKADKSQLGNYYTKSETYNKTDANNAF
jgi:hypothetical protein